MKTTSHRRAPLERLQHNRGMHPRIAESRLRAALHAVISDRAAASGQHTPQPAHAWHDLTREQPRAALPCERERAMITAAIRQGCTTRHQVLTYFLVRIEDAMAQFPDADKLQTSDVLYVHAMAEIAEAQESIARAHTMPSDEARAAAAREGREAYQALELVVSTYECGRPLPFPGIR